MPELEVVFDYAEPLENYLADRRAYVTAVAARAAALGEPWLSLFDPADLSGLLREKGFATVEDLGLADISDRFYGILKQGISIGPGAHVSSPTNRVAGARIESPCLKASSLAWSKRLAQKLRTLQPISPWQFNRLGEADPNAGDDLRLARPRMQRDRRRIERQPVMRMGDPERFA